MKEHGYAASARGNADPASRVVTVQGGEGLGDGVLIGRGERLEPVGLAGLDEPASDSRHLLAGLGELLPNDLPEDGSLSEIGGCPVGGDVDELAARRLGDPEPVSRVRTSKGR